MNRTSALGYGLAQLLLLVCPAFVSVAAAQGTGRIQGVVTTLGSGGAPVPIPGANARLICKTLLKGSLSTTTDETGGYSFTDLAPGACELVVSAAGFTEQSKEVQIQPAATGTVNIQLTLQTVAQKVEVHGEPATLSTRSPAPASTVSSTQLEALPIAEEKFKSALPVVPGVIRTPDGKLDIRGSPEDRGMLVVASAKTVDPATGSFSVPAPIDVIQKLSVNRAPYDTRYDGFTGGLVVVETRPPPSQWHYKLSDINVSLRAKNGHLVGISEAEPRVYLGGPLVPGKLNVSEAFEYELRKDPVRGLSWPRNEIKKQGFGSFTTFQAFLSRQHLLTGHANLFSQRTQFADINALLPQSASSDGDKKGGALELFDIYSFPSGAILSTVLQYTRFDSSSHGQGPAGLLITPDGWAGNFFNSWKRAANQFEAFPDFQLSPKSWRGRHELSLGADLTYRSFSGRSLSDPIQLIGEDGSLAEQISFQATGSLHASVTEVAGFLEDDWLVNDHFTLDFGSRLVGQSVGRSAAFAPRAGLAYSPGRDQKTVFRAGAGFFYDSVPLLAAGFSGNPMRVVELFGQTGQVLGTPEVFQNVYIANGTGPLPERIRREPNTSPRGILANVEVERRIWRAGALRFGYTYSQTHDLFLVNPLPSLPPGQSILSLTNSGNSYDHEFVATIHLRPGEGNELNASYVWSRARGDLNTISDIYIPFEQPVIRADARGILPSDIPNRLVGWGVFRAPWGFTVSPVIDLHTGFPYSKVDDQQNYVGEPNGARFPTFFSLDFKIYRQFRLPFLKRRSVRVGYYSLNLTNHGNYNAVYNNVTASLFGQFAGFERRVNGIVLDIAD